MRLDGPQKITMKAQPRLQIREGMSIEDVKKHGSEGQKLAANLFDIDAEGKKDANGNYLLKDGIFNKKEAEYFNRFNFSVKDGSFTMYDRESGHVTEIKYDNIDDLKKALNADVNEPTTMHFFGKNGEQKLYVGTVGATNGKTTIDLSKRTVEINGLTNGSIFTNGNKTTVKNSNLELISSSSKEVDIQNVKYNQWFGDTETGITVGTKTILNVDGNSKVDIERKDK